VVSAVEAIMMASSSEFVEYVAGQLAGAGNITYRKMFGEYGIYCDGKFFACACDNQFLVKITEAGKKFMPGGRTASPYPGAKPCFLIDDLDDREFLRELTAITCAALPAPRPKKRRAGTAARRQGEE
jgi:TfoX/Sxy family transcriptional regulator of competence genes